MGDLQFAKQYLNSLDAKSNKYDSNYVFDPTKFPIRTPYTLPKLSHPPHPVPPRSGSLSTPAPGSEVAESAISIILKSSRNPNMSLVIDELKPSTTTMQSLKEKVQGHLGGSSVVEISKIKILLNKKPIPSSKRTLADALEGVVNTGGSRVEFGIFVMGGAPDPPPQSTEKGDVDTIKASAPESEKAAVEVNEKGSIVDSTTTPMQGIEKITSPSVEPEGRALVETSEFWDDLEGFLKQRLRDGGEAERLRRLFTQAWIASRTKS